MNRIDTNKISFWGLTFLLLLFVEAMFFHNGNIISVIIGAALIYFGMRRRSKFFLVSGLISIIIALFTLWSLRLFIFATILYVLFKLWKGVPSEEIIRPLREMQNKSSDGIWKNKLFSIQTSPLSSYEWEDIHIQGVFGDLRIDVTDTVLPNGTSFISVRQGFGKIKIDIPYEIPVRIHYTTLFGDAKLFGVKKTRLMNEFLHMNDGYTGHSGDKAELIITLSTWVGDVEVTRK